MFFNSVRVRNFRCFEDTGRQPLGPITLIVGHNNSGKSALLRAIFAIQEGQPPKPSDIRIGAKEAFVELGVTNNDLPILIGSGSPAREIMGGGHLMYKIEAQGVRDALLKPSMGQAVAITRPPAQAPNHFIHPIFSGRFTAYQQNSDSKTARQVWPNDSNIISRVKQIANADIAEGRRFRELCRNILGIRFEALDTENGGGSQQLGVTIDLDNKITWDYMGAGLAGSLNLLVTLSTAKGKLILLEEPENDLHPTALKSLLDEVVRSSESNQFIISTHNSTVVTRLGSTPKAVVLYTSSNGESLPTSTVKPINSASERLTVLSDLGYEFADLSLGDGWLIFEESSAQRIVKDFLAPWFTPSVSKLRIIGAMGDSRILPIMLDYKELFLFAHLEDAYRGRAWVVVDGGANGAKIVKDLRAAFRSWPEQRFSQWRETDFERYYPDEFADDVETALAEHDKRKKKAAKKQLLDKVIAWIRTDEDLARTKFESSAAEVIAKLREIEAEMQQLRFGASPLPLEPASL